MAKEIKKLGASVRARLLRISKEKGQNFELILTRFAIERLLYRLAQSRHADRFVLKGAMLLMTWFDEPFRGTRDLNLLGYGDPSPEGLVDIFKEVLAVDGEDGVAFDVDGVRIIRIRKDNQYGAGRLRTTADIGGAIRPAAGKPLQESKQPRKNRLSCPALLNFCADPIRRNAKEFTPPDQLIAGNNNREILR